MYSRDYGDDGLQYLYANGADYFSGVYESLGTEVIATALVAQPYIL